MQDVIRSLFSLIKTNNGFFKSDKQTAFLLKSFDNGVMITRKSLSFGEYEGRTARNTATVEWTFHADAQGVTKVEKTTSKGTTIYWERLSQEEVQAKAVADASRKAANKAAEEAANAEWQARQDALANAINAAKQAIIEEMGNTERAQRAADMMVKGQSDVEGMLDDLKTNATFCKAWEAFQATNKFK